MKKIVSLLMVFSFVGCSPEGTALIKEMKQTAAWEATKQSGKMTVEVTVADDTAKVDLEYTAYCGTKDTQVEMTLNFKKIEAEGIAIDFEKAKVPPMKIYVDQTKVYMSTATLKAIADITKEDISAMDLSKEYIVMDAAEMYKAMGIDITQVLKEAQNNNMAMCDELAALDVQLPIKQEDRTFTIDLNGAQSADIAAQFMAKQVEANKPLIEKQLKESGLSEEQIKAAMKNVEAGADQKTMTQLKDMFKDSSVKFVVTYEDNKQTADCEMVLNMEVLGEKMVAKYTMDVVSEKAEAKAITFPTDVKVFSVAELMAQEVAAEKAAVEEAMTKEKAATIEKKAETTTDKKAA